MNLPLYVCQEPPSLGTEGNRGLWYGRFFNHYTDAWTIPDNGKSQWVSDNAKSTGNKEALQAHALRHLALVEALSGRCALFKTDWYFATGLGLPHPVENGLAWHHTLGVPYLAGSGVKGLIKAWVEIWDESLNQEQRDDRLKNWFGTQEQAGRFLFFDAIPIAPVQLAADVMTPHMDKWYEQGAQINDYRREPEKVPADWHDPVPVPFLVVQQARFLFGIAPRRPAFAGELNQVLEALKNTLTWLGAGAKTAVGYGRMEVDDKALTDLQAELRKRQQAQLDETARRERLAKMSPLERSIQKVLDNAPSGQRRHVVLLKALQQDNWSDEKVIQVAEHIYSIMIEDKTWRPTSEKKNPAKDDDHQATLKVLAYLGKKS